VESIGLNSESPLTWQHFVASKLERRERPSGEHVCGKCRQRGVGHGPDGQLRLVQEKRQDLASFVNLHVDEFCFPFYRIPALLVFTILVLYTALGGLLMSQLEQWSFFTSFYWSFITMTTGKLSAHFTNQPCLQSVLAI
jgi:hypothetical protein